MSANPNISRDIFNKAKRYFGVRLQQGTPVFDWDINESYDEISWFIQAYWNSFCGGAFDEGVRFKASNGAKKFTISPIGSSNNFLIEGGTAIVSGRLILEEQGSFDYDEASNTPVNYIVTGKVSSIVETTPSGDYTITDNEQAFTANHDLTGAIVRFTSGVESGNEFEVASSPSSTDIQILDDISSVVATDTFVIKPRRITTPASPSGQTDTFKLVTWFESISSEQDPDLIDLTPVDANLHVEPSHRRQLRWCVYSNWTGTDGTDTINDFISLDMGSVTRPQSQATISNSDFTDVDNYVHVSSYISSTLDRHQSIFEEEFDWETSKSSSVSYDFATTSNTLPRTISINEGKYVTSYFSSNNDSPNIVTKESETFVNSTAGASWKMLDINGGSVTDSQTVPTGGDIALDDLVYLAIEDDGVNIINAFPMGEIPQKQGYDWLLDKNSGNLVVMPGQLRILGKILQTPTDYTVNATDINNYITTTAFTGIDTWVYVYLVFEASTNRSATVKFDLIEPLYNGSHPNITAGVHGFCIGFFRLNSSNAVEYGAICRDNKVYFAQNVGSIYTSVTSQGGASGLQDLFVEVPVGASSVTMEISAVDVTVNSLTFAVVNEYNSNIIFNNERVIDLGNVTTESVSKTVDSPCNFGLLKGKVQYNTFSAGDVIVKLLAISYQYNYMPKPNLWSI